jgi:hypothetical protein
LAKPVGMVLCFTLGVSAIQPPRGLRMGTPISPGVKPTAANTGWQPTGVTLTASGSISITTQGTVVESKDVSGTITIQANNVTIKRCRVRSSSYYPIHVVSGTGITIEDTEVDGQGGSSKAIYISNGQVTVQRCNIHDSEDGLSLNGTGGLTIINNYVHSPRHDSAGHSDGFELYSGAHMTIQNNNFDYTGGNTSASNFSNWGGAIDDVLYDHNWLAGGSYNLYVDGSFSSSNYISHVRITNNRWIRGSSAYGTHVIRGALSNITWTGNVFDDNDQVISQ